MSFPWFRLYHEARNDAKLRSLTDAQFRVWFNLICLAAERSEDGTITDLTESRIAVEAAGGGLDLLRSTCEALMALEIITLDRNEDVTPCNTPKGVTGRYKALQGVTITFLSFKKRNHRKPCESKNRVRERVAKHRKTKTYERSKNGNTLSNAPVTPPLSREDSEQQQAAADLKAALASGPAESPLAEGGSLAACIEVARTLFGPEAARSVEANGPDINRNLQGRFDCYAAALRKVHADQAKPKAQPVRNLHSLAVNIAKRLIREGIPPEPVTVEVRLQQENSMAEKAARIAKRLGLDKETP